MQFQFDNSYAALPERFFARVAPEPVASPRLVKLNRPLAHELRLDADWLASADGVRVLAGQTVPDEADPIATAYAGHQFGTFVPQLGDGRAILLGEVVDRSGQRRDLQLKGAGRTPFSRRGDGRAAIGPVLREYIVSEAMAALGIPTTRALAAVLTGEKVQRERMLPGAVLTRIAASHIRIGTFQFFATRGDDEAVRRLADHVIARHYPELAGEAKPYRALLSRVIERQAQLVAKWMQVGFIHGVMNTDNCSIAGETIDYGPCAFMDEFDPSAVFSSIDQTGRYAFANQPRIALWNLTRLAECLLPLLADEQEKAIEIAKEALGEFSDAFDAVFTTGMLAKLGVAGGADDEGLIAEFLALLAENQADFTFAFRRLCDAADDDASGLRAMFAEPAGFDAWSVKWRHVREQRRLASGEMRKINPAFIPRNHRVEAVIQAALRDDFAPFEELLTVLSRPYDDQPAFAAYAEPPAPEERVTQTFCGT
ncbi:protein adenylyltransferase SelO family protein [Bradyrhizobium sp. LHD-71]|uniref:protein adenylyltransferase SelO n=1 Tax=Bradyrhizobium sp. LHD-71 TaxID=3072141 RepID=UPI00280D958C|nr:YdiU family protein [Bradyrhizobium sp. LHD-71]MDQ8731838.1 YdiU family protein [Bradyrhizobium sp. LHD-71]